MSEEELDGDVAQREPPNESGDPTLPERRRGIVHRHHSKLRMRRCEQEVAEREGHSQYQECEQVAENQAPQLGRPGENQEGANTAASKSENAHQLQ
jgi:hypothetical protein